MASSEGHVSAAPPLAPAIPPAQSVPPPPSSPTSYPGQGQ
jgi:hypothetical protein